MMKRVMMVTAAAALASSAHATLVDVEINGEVFFNAIQDAPLSGVSSGDSAVIAFRVDSNNFVDGVPGDTRGYEIDQASFEMTFGGVITQTLLNPFPGTPYFGIVDGFPVSDGFFVSSSTVSPGGVALDQTPFNANFSAGYSGDTLSSLDILDAVGTYDFNGLTSFGFSLWSGFPDNKAMGIDFVNMTITTVPAPAGLAIFAPLAFFRRRRRD